MFFHDFFTGLTSTSDRIPNKPHFLVSTNRKEQPYTEEDKTPQQSSNGDKHTASSMASEPQEEVEGATSGLMQKTAKPGADVVF